MIHVFYLYIFYWILAAIGLTVGYHRTIAHRDIELPPVLETLVVYVGLVCSACSPLSWAGVHRMHHAYADTPKDPHSPKYKKWYEVLFSSYRIKSIPRKFVRDLYDNSIVMFFHTYRWYVLGVTYLIAILINPLLFFYFILILPISFVCYGIVNLFGHSENGAENVWWINIFAPFEGNHYDHHTS